MNKTSLSANGSRILLWSSWGFSRLLAVASLSILSLFVIAHIWEATTQPGTPTPKETEWLLLALFPTGVLLGLAVGLRYSLAGGIIAVFSLALFYMLHHLLFHRIPSGPYFVLLTAPAGLLIVDGLIHQFSPTPNDGSQG